ncbi:hypothetical protein [Paracoccus litorisediminis]|uniref:Uncharacterized protein n=1 Tax=Paracoccus litorisediminis TaxID=2006130 RepID=A0A844HUL3_9RHOB|nr:hypothetical protein [Paracoccus litorisediminis]MTH62154.1 hypothetical protein [Paracoccus litorisediminis]
MQARFIFSPSDDPENTDDEYKLVEDESVSIQVCAYGGKTTYAVNETGYDQPGNDDSLWVKDHGHFTSLKAAQTHAIEVAQKRRMEGHNQ